MQLGFKAYVPHTRKLELFEEMGYEPRFKNGERVSEKYIGRVVTRMIRGEEQRVKVAECRFIGDEETEDRMLEPGDLEYPVDDECKQMFGLDMYRRYMGLVIRSEAKLETKRKKSANGKVCKEDLPKNDELYRKAMFGKDTWECVLPHVPDGGKKRKETSTCDPSLIVEIEDEEEYIYPTVQEVTSKKARVEPKEKVDKKKDDVNVNYCGIEMISFIPENELKSYVFLDEDCNVIKPEQHLFDSN